MSFEDAWSTLTDSVRALASEGYLPADLAGLELRPETRIEDLGMDSIGATMLLNDVEDRLDADLDRRGLEQIVTLGALAGAFVETGAGVSP